MHFSQEFAPLNLTREKFCQNLKDAGLTEIEIPNATILLNEEPLYREPYIILPHIYGFENSQTARDYKNQFEECYADNFDKAKAFRASAIKLPVWAFLDEEHILDRYIDTIIKVADKYLNIN